MDLKKTEKLNELFSYYYKLLTAKQIDYFQLYYHQDYSLSEIAEISKVSRNAVYDQLKKVEKKLYEFEDKLKLLSTSQKRQQLIEKFLKTKDEKYLNQIKEMEHNDE